MAPARMMTNERSSLPFWEPGADGHPIYRRLGLLNGLLIGLGLGVSIWGPQAVLLANLPISLQTQSLLFSSLVLMVMGGLAGWLSSRLVKTGLTLLIWVGTAVLVSFTIHHLPLQARNFSVWLTDRRFWGLPIYIFAGGGWLAQILSGFFVILLLAILAILQDQRLEAALRERTNKGRTGLRSWLLLLRPMPFVIVAGLATGSLIGTRVWRAPQLVYEAIQTGRTYEGDLFQLGLATGLNYSAIRGVREQMSDTFSLTVAEIDPASASIFVTATFDNGAWIHCRVINEQLSFCYDAAPPYTVGLTSLITGVPVLEDCRRCLPGISDEWQAWLAARRANLGDAPLIERQAQWGSYVLMRAKSPSGDYGLDCWFNGIERVQLERCAEIGDR